MRPASFSCISAVVVNVFEIEPMFCSASKLIGRLALDIGKAVGVRPDDVAVADDAGGDARNVARRRLPSR